MSFRRIDEQPLMLDSSNKKFGGVCGGIGRYLDIAPLFVRIAAIVMLCIAPQPTLLAYGLAWAILSDGPSRRRFDDSEYWLVYSKELIEARRQSRIGNDINSHIENHIGDHI